jgi:hypothetical protein
MSNIKAICIYRFYNKSALVNLFIQYIVITGNLSFFPINTRFIFIYWYENKYFMRNSSLE